MPAITEAVQQQQDSDLYFTFFSSGEPDADLVVRSFTAHEEVSALYRIELELASERSDIDLTKLVDKPGVLTIHDRYGQPRHLQQPGGGGGRRAIPGIITPSTVWC
jgi:uncharacterized protein involved in type VI secretion and phage assembly